MTSKLFAAFLVTLLWLSPVLAQSYSDQRSPSENDHSENATASLNRYPFLSNVEANASASSASTLLIVRALADARNTCAAIRPKEYMIDCLSYELWSIAREMPKIGSYADASKAIGVAAEKLKRLAENNADPKLQPARFRRESEGRKTTLRKLTPIDKAKRRDVGRQAAAIIAETETVLLRSAGNSALRRIHYEQISAALGTNKVLLRSL